MTPSERTLLLATAALALGRAEPGIIPPEDKAYLAELLGDNKDWPSVVAALMPLIKAVKEGEG